MFYMHSAHGGLAGWPRDRQPLFYFLNLGSRSFSSLFAVQAGPDQERKCRLIHPDGSGQTPRCLAHSNIFYTTPSTRAQCTPPPSHAFSLPNQILSLSQCSEAAQDRGRAHRKSRHWAWWILGCVLWVHGHMAQKLRCKIFQRRFYTAVPCSGFSSTATKIAETTDPTKPLRA